MGLRLLGNNRLCFSRNRTGFRFGCEAAYRQAAMSGARLLSRRLRDIFEATRCARRRANQTVTNRGAQP
jgi:hypothetical protein